MSTGDGEELAGKPGVLVCAECGAPSPPDARGWRSYLTDDGEAEVFCPKCAAQEFGEGGE